MTNVPPDVGFGSRDRPEDCGSKRLEARVSDDPITPSMIEAGVLALVSSDDDAFGSRPSSLLRPIVIESIWQCGRMF